MTEPGAADNPQELVRRIVQVVAEAGQRVGGWQRIAITYRALGRYAELDVHAWRGSTESVEVPVEAEITELFGRLRAAMYRQDGPGAWLTARVTIESDFRFSVAFDGAERPEWRQEPAPDAAAEELRDWPRAGGFVPEWLASASRAAKRRTVGRAAVAAPADAEERADSGEPTESGEQGEPSPTGDDSVVPPADIESEVEEPVRLAAVADVAADGDSDTDAAPSRMAGAERDRILAYLDGGSVVAGARSMGVDERDPRRPAKIPLIYSTDGTWVWPEAIIYYLREYGIAPQPELVTHIRAMNYELPEIADERVDAALATLTESGLS